MRIVVDTNIVFSAILNSSKKIGSLLLNSKTHFQFYSCDFLSVELLKHRNKLLRLTNLTEIQLLELENLVTKNIRFINESLLPKNDIVLAEKLLKDIDLKDVPFIALASHLKAKLWTRDLKLAGGLQKKRYKNIISTAELSLLFDELEA